MKLLRLACLALTAAAGLPAQEPRLANVSTLTRVGTGADVLTAGFVVTGTSPKQVVVRAVGPTLGSVFNVPAVLANPTLTVFGPDSSTRVAASNDDWQLANAPAFAAVGAFALNGGSRDAALVATLDPGSYTAQVSGVGGTTGTALVEVYESDTSGRFVNLSTRAQVGGAAGILTPGFVITAGAGARRLLIRAAGPALSVFNLNGLLGDPTLTLIRTGATNTTVATNDNWSTPVGADAATAAQLSAAFTQAGAFAFPANSRDAALLVDLPPGNYTVQASGAAGAAGLALVEIYDLTPTGNATVTLAATRTTAGENGSSTGEFTFTRAGGNTLTSLTVNYGVSGSATNGIDFPALLGAITFPPGELTVKLPLVPLADTTVEPTETVTLTLSEGNGYVIGAAASGSVSIADSPGTLYVATLRPASGATGSAASGLATLVLSANGQIASVNVTFSNLSSGQAGAHLFLGNSTSAGDYVMNLPLGQVSGAQWNIAPTATYSNAQILDALRNGLIYVGLDTGNFPAGELRGAFLGASGSQVFTAPPPAPAVALTGVSATDAARLLIQGTFGPKRSEIDALAGGSINAWLDAQLAAAPSLHRPAELAEWNAAKADAVARGLDPADVLNSLQFRRRAWYQVILGAPDQLRQRVAFALSQILVVGDDPFGVGQTEGLANYYDVLVNGAFGNFRTLLENVTLSPIMGTYLSSLRNAKADPAAGTYPDENYAREVMQLFSIGLVLLQPDGTLKLDAQGLPIPTYTNTTITEMAKVFTGWGFFSTRVNPSFRGERAEYLTPMMLYPGSHEPGPKAIVNNVTIPANLGGTEDLKRALDTLFNHPNCGPFICRQLIQRLVTDNPSPAYVYRVAQKFENNGAGVRGDLGAVVRAILTDYEARSTAVVDDPGYGKLKEPLLRLTALLRGFGATSTTGRNQLENAVYTALAQGPLESPTVFNFFEPGYVYPGPLAGAGLVAPEFQITNDTTAITVPNYLRDTIFRANNAAGTNYVLNFTAEQALVPTPAALVDHLNLVLAGGALSPATRARIVSALGAMPANTSILERTQSAVLLVATSLDGATQK